MGEGQEQPKESGPQFLTQQQCEQYHRDGYLVLPNFWSVETCTTLRSQIHSIIEGMDLDESRTVFSTKEDQGHARDEYFLTSGDKVRFFWEPDAFTPEGEFRQERSKCINKIGHALHDLDPEFQKFSYEKKVGQLCRDLGMRRPLACQSMYIFKQPKIGGEVAPHQDGTFLYTEPQSVIGLWWALEDCTTTNGCLWAVPGSHNLGVRRRFRRKPDGSGTELHPPGQDEWDLTGGVKLEVTAGTLVVLHNAVVHYSGANSSAQSRHAYSVHVIEGEGCNYPPDNWLQTTRGSFNELP